MALSLYIVRPDCEASSANMHEAVVSTLRNGPHYVEVALELWKLAGHDERAAEIKSLLESAYERDNHVLTTEEVHSLDHLLDGLEDALKKTIMDSSSRVSIEKLPELRRHACVIDLREHPERDTGLALSEANSQVYLLREFLKQAIDRGLHVALD